MTSAVRFPSAGLRMTTPRNDERSEKVLKSDFDMRQMMDYERGADYDLKAVNGDWRRVESTAAHQVSLILDAPGEYAHTPAVCVGGLNYIDDEGVQGIVRKISQQFMQDGMEVKQVVLGADGVIHSEAEYV
jgi:hypothetical protein